VKIVLDQALCTGHGRCYDLAPELFDGDDYGHCVRKHVTVPGGLEAQAEQAVSNCPERALSLEK